MMRRSTTRGDGTAAWLRRSTWRASVTSGLAAVMAAALVSGSRDPVADVLAGSPSPPQTTTDGAPAVSPPTTGPHLPWPHGRDTQTPASTSRRTTPAALVDPADIPPTALVAYQRAAAVIDTADPSCRLDWALLAAIGRVESDHGRFGGSSLDAQGVDRPAVLGPVLDGKHGTSLVRDTDAGRLDHDRRYDRAVGPMQFLPSTWSVVAVDGDADGRRDPQDIDDAALGSAVYLCSGADDLSTKAGQRAAVYRYNHSTAYVDDVLAIARAYRSGSPFFGPTTAAGPFDPWLPTQAAHPDPAAHHPARHPSTPSTSGTPSPSEPTSSPTGSPDPTTDPSDLTTATPITMSHGPLPTPSPGDPGSEPTDGPTDGPTSTPTESPSDDPTGTPSGNPSEDPTEDPTGSPSPGNEPTAPPSEPPVIPEARPIALAGLSAAQMRAIDDAWPVCRDALPTDWTDDALLGCLADETGIPRHNADLVAFVHWLGRHEPDPAP